MARLYLLRDDASKAEEQILEAFALDPNHADVFLHLGNIQFLTHRYPEAQKSYESALKTPNGTRSFSFTFLLPCSARSGSVYPSLWVCVG